ncbi:MAG: response regulator [Pseudomonadota bacterium]
MAHILVLEDDAILAGQLQELLETEDHTVVLFPTVAEALDYVKQNEVDLIITDIFIKEKGKHNAVGGVTLISTIKQLMKKEVPIIAISGAFTGPDHEHSNSGLIRETARTVGATVLLAKPFTPAELFYLVTVCLEHGTPEKR